MNNTAHFGLTNNGALVNLGVGANNGEVANLLADNAESVARAEGRNLDIVVILDINDLYRLRGEMADLLNNLDTEALGGELKTFGIDVEAEDAVTA